MSYEMDLPGPADHTRVINIDEAWERGYWSARLSVTERELRTAVSAVGEMVVDVKKHLGK